jgi:hypothetical protein
LRRKSENPPEFTEAEARWLQSAARFGLLPEKPKPTPKLRKAKRPKKPKWKGRRAKVQIAKARNALRRAGAFWRSAVKDRM